MQIIEITTSEVRNSINQIKKGKACGYDGVSNSLLNLN